jgi:hypothetical protein
MLRLSLLLALSACATERAKDTATVAPPEAPLSEEILSRVSPNRMKAAIDYLADESMGGRIPGSLGHAAAMEWIIQEMQDIGLQPVGLEGDFVYPYPTTAWEGHYQLEADGSLSVSSVDVGYDLVGRLPGSDPALAHEHILIMAHYDHLGMSEDGDAFNGAFDNAGGVAVALELARILIAPDAIPARSVIFLLTDEEEGGLNGARTWLNDPTIPTDQIVFGMSIDPVGRPSLPDYWPTLLIGTERSPELDSLWRAAAEWNDQPTVFINRDLIPIFASDQDELYDLDPPIPGLWFVNPGFSYYHTVDDTPQTIDYRILRDDVRFLAQAITMAGADAPSFSFDPAPPLDTGSVADVKALMTGILTSEVLTGDEREYAEWVVGEFDKAIAADSLDPLGNIEGFTMAVAWFVMFELGDAHPGPIPPPFPEE